MLDVRPRKQLTRNYRAIIVFNELAKRKKLATLSSRQPFGYIGRLVSFLVDLLCQGRDFVGAQGYIVNAEIIDQAGEEGSSMPVVCADVAGKT